MLECKLRRIGDVSILDLSGHMSRFEALALGPGKSVLLLETVRELLKAGERKILLNLKGVATIDTSGLGELTGALTSARKQGAALKLLSPNKKVMDLLRGTLLHTVFDITEDESSAVQSFSGRIAAAG